MQDETSAIIAVVLYTVGRSLGSLWSPIYLHLFPVESFGFIFGMTCLVSLPFQLAISPMSAYNNENNDYSLMNYIMAGISATTIALPIATWLTKSPTPENSSISAYTKPEEISAETDL